MELPVVGSVARPSTRAILPFAEYDRVIVSFSGGKDSLACLLRLLEMGCPRGKIELWHQDVDGGAGAFMDWPVTPAYCRAVAAAFGIPILFQWKVGGFRGEMLREEALTMPVRFTRRDGTVGEAGGKGGKKSTRRKFPQVSADLKVRWCSAYLKIDVAAIALNNDPDLKRAKVLFVTGERRQESSARAKYAELEPRRCDSLRRRVDAWRAVIDFSEAQVWDIIRRHRVVPHPAYLLGWGRVSCLQCIFGNADQWASARVVAPASFGEVAGYEREFGTTIKRGKAVGELADAGTPYPQTADPALVALATGEAYPGPVFTDDWQMPPGAFAHCGGPT